MSDRDLIRKRPGMYIGDTDDGSGLQNMICEVADNAINEALAGFGKMVEIVLEADGSCTVRDEGRGIPVAQHPEEHLSAAEIIMTRLAPRGSYAKHDPPHTLHGSGVAVVTALSERLELRIWRDDKGFFIAFRDGEREGPIALAGAAGGRRGTEINFVPSAEVFSNIKFDFNMLVERFRNLGLLSGDIALRLADHRRNPAEEVVLML